MNKADYRSLFNDLKKYVKINPFLKELGIGQANMSHFMTGYDYSMSLENLDKLHKKIIDRIEKFA